MAPSGSRERLGEDRLQSTVEEVRAYGVSDGELEVPFTDCPPCRSVRRTPAVAAPGKWDTAPMRFFNTTGPVEAADHYCIPPLERLDLDALLRLIREKRYFVMHAPRQTGKTSALLALRDLLNAGTVGDYRCVYANFEVGQAAREDTARAMRAMLGSLASRIRTTLGDTSLANSWSGILDEYGPDAALQEALIRWTESDPRPVVLMVDEIDALIGDTLVSVLRQLRAGYDMRPASFPHSIILCGVRDVRDYRIHASSEKEPVAGGSAFNIKAESLRLGDFDEGETHALLAQHTESTGQAFAAEALDTIWTQTQGQPWLVNALAAETCFRDKAGRDRARPVTAEHITDAREQLILRRVTHLDQLGKQLEEARVRRVVEPILSGADEDQDAFSSQDLDYVRDLGLVARHPPLRIANPIYAEVVPRELTSAAQERLVQETAWYVDDDGSLNVAKLIEAFQSFFREHAEHWLERFDYREAGAQLLLQAFLQRVVNSGGRIEREYGLGRGRTDLLIVWTAGARPTRFVIECKLLHAKSGLEATIRKAFSRPSATWIAAARSPGTWWSSIAQRTSLGQRRSSVATRTASAGR